MTCIKRLSIEQDLSYYFVCSRINYRDRVIIIVGNINCFCKFVKSYARGAISNRNVFSYFSIIIFINYRNSVIFNVSNINSIFVCVNTYSSRSLSNRNVFSYFTIIICINYRNTLLMIMAVIVPSNINVLRSDQDCSKRLYATIGICKLAIVQHQL
jgi:hypothetical protein